MSRISNRKIWEAGTPLVEAWKAFGNCKLAAQLSEMPGGLDTFNDAAASDPGARLAEASLLALRANHDRQNLILQMRETLLDDLFNSDLAAMGFRELPSTSSAPVKIEPDFFERPKINWDRNFAESIGKKFNRIRVFDPHAAVALVQKKGRPGSNESIISAIDRLIRENPDFCDQSRKISCEQIRELIAPKSILGSGLSDQNLGRYIVKKCPKRGIKF